MTWAMSSGVRSNIRKIAVAGVLIAISTAAVSHHRRPNRQPVSTTTQMTQMTGGLTLALAVSECPRRSRLCEYQVAEQASSSPSLTSDQPRVLAGKAQFPLDAVALRRDINEAQAHITGLQRRYSGGEIAASQGAQQAR
jgi:hypothetical protein